VRHRGSRDSARSRSARITSRLRFRRALNSGASETASGAQHQCAAARGRSDAKTWLRRHQLMEEVPPFPCGSPGMVG
jgi:hypothetical protein